MLFLHCGWPRTGTTSLQGAFYRNREALAEVGLLYPEQWLGVKAPAHHALSRLLSTAGAVADLHREFGRFLEERHDYDVLISAEGLTERFGVEEEAEALLGLIAVAREVMPATILWTMRRADDLAISGYLMMLKAGRGKELTSPEAYMSSTTDTSRLFAGMQRMADAAGGNALYFKYDPGGAHARELIKACGLGGRAEAGMRTTLERTPRRNVSPTHKQAVVLANLAAMSRSAGVALDVDRLRDAFFEDNFRFEEDWRCELVDGDVRQAAHERVLKTARQCGFAPYCEFFQDEEISATSRVVGLDHRIVTEVDLERLVAHLACSAELSVMTEGPR